ncbi:hypothetical protein LTR08_003208 [Meristemomyces frigidus]|nr:hypothetical protein LTR08_003208 [Meristemomyces frigidus]
MSLREAYSLAHSAQCRLNLEASRPERNLRFVVGHLMHYESLRLRIVEIEHDVSRSERASAVRFQGTGQVCTKMQHKPSTGQLRQKSPPPPVVEYDDDDGDDDSMSDGLSDEVDGIEDLILTRFPSASAQPSQPTPELEQDDADYDDYEADEAISPGDPDQAMLGQIVKGDGNEDLTKMYEHVRVCPCHGEVDAPRIERMWELPAGEGGTKEGWTRAVAQVAA